MKTKILRVLFILILSGTTSNGYSNTSSLKRVIKKALHKEVEIKLDIISSSGEILISKFIKSNSFVLDNFNLKKFEPGIYFIELHKDFEVKVYKMVISNSREASLDYTNKYFKPYVYSKQHKIFLNKLHLTSSPVEISIYYEKELIYEEVIINKKKLERVYSLDLSKTGYYEVLIMTEGKTYSSILYL